VFRVSGRSVIRHGRAWRAAFATNNKQHRRPPLRRGRLAEDNYLIRLIRVGGRLAFSPHAGGLARFAWFPRWLELSADPQTIIERTRRINTITGTRARRGRGRGRGRGRVTQGDLRGGRGVGGKSKGLNPSQAAIGRQGVLLMYGGRQ
jgi:hypothetical protein